MSGRPSVDGIQFARTSGELRVLVPISDFERLTDVVLDDTGDFEVRIEGFVDSSSMPRLRLRVIGAIALTCQRCLERLSIDVASDRQFILVESDADMMDLADEDDSIESLRVYGEIDVIDLAEDEILLQIPIAPKHERGTCIEPEWTTRGKGRRGAFDALDVLMKAKD